MGGLPETAGGVLGGPGKKQFGNQGPEAQPRKPPASTRLCHARGEAPQERALAVPAPPAEPRPGSAPEPGPT